MSNEELKLKCYEVAKPNSIDPLSDAQQLYEWVKEVPKKETEITKEGLIIPEWVTEHNRQF